MKKLLLLLLTALTAHGASFTEFYAQTTGDNLNAGSTTADASLVTSANGNWDSTTGVFICNGATDLSAVTTGMWASVYIDGATVGVFVARITAVVDATDTITVSLTAMSGTAPATSATARTIKIGGAWKGPNAAVGFPFGFITAAAVNTSSHPPRVNIKGGTTYSITAAMTHANNGPIRWQGYTTTVGDFGRATIDGGSGASYVMLTASCANNDFVDLIFANNGTASGASIMFSVTGVENNLFRCVFHDSRGLGLSAGGVGTHVVECEAYACNLSNTAGLAGLSTSSATVAFLRCVSHDNTGSNTAGFRDTGGATFISCISDTNGKEGFLIGSTLATRIYGCESYNNTGAGLDMTGATAFNILIENCNFIKNGGWGITSSVAPTLRNGSIFNCGFGSGTQANTSGTIDPAIFGVNDFGTITYSANVTPWIDPANGDFRITLAASKGTGRGTYTETAASYAGTIGYPDVGAAQHVEATRPTAFVFAQ